MKLLHVIEGLDIRIGGLSYLLASITTFEKTIGIENEIFSLECPDEFFNSNIQCKVNLFPLSFPERYYNTNEGLNWLSENVVMYDLVVIHGIWNFLCQRSASIAHEKNVPYIVWPHNSLDPFDLKKKSFAKKVLGSLFIKKFLTNALAICSASNLESARLELYGANTPKYVLPYPVKFSYSTGDRERFRAKYGLEKDMFTFLFLSRIDFKKGLDLAILAYKRIFKEFTNSTFIIAGPDTKGYVKYINKLIERENLSSSVKLIGSVAGEEKADALLGADCFVLSSHNESFGIAVVEALQSGLPVIISDCVYIHEDVHKLDGGWICEPTIVSIYESMHKSLTDLPGYILKRGNASKAGKYFSDENRLRSIYSNFYSKMELVITKK